MRDVKYIAGVEMVTEECIKCHTVFAMTKELKDQLLSSHKDFYCPRGHSMFYNSKSREDKLKEQLNQANARASQAITRATLAEQARDDARASHKRMRTKVQSGQCVCCDQTFDNLRQHMEANHADKPGAALRTARIAHGLTQDQLAEEIGQGMTAVLISRRENEHHVADHWVEEIQDWIEKNI